MLRGALVGLGNIALKGHLPAYRSDASVRARARIVAVVDLVEPTPGGVAAELYGTAYHRDLESLLRHERLDFVDICTPPDSHAVCIEMCAAAGVDVLCEKPLTHDNEAVAGVARAVRESSVVFVPCHQYKYAPLWQAIHEFVTSGELGQITLAQFNVFRTRADVGTAGWNPQWRTRKEHGGGGVLTDTGAHYFYLSRWLFGMPERIAAVLRTLKHVEYGVEDTATVTLEHADKLVQLNLTWAASYRANAVHIVGSEGSLHYDGARLVHVTAKGEREIPMPNVADKSQYVGWYAALAREFVRRVEERDLSLDLLEEAEAVMRLLDVSYRASATGTTLAVD